MKLLNSIQRSSRVLLLRYIYFHPTASNAIAQNLTFMNSLIFPPEEYYNNSTMSSIHPNLPKDPTVRDEARNTSEPSLADLIPRHVFQPSRGDIFPSGSITRGPSRPRVN